MKRLPSAITIDGPAASGKSTLGGLLAQRLGYLYFDTGVMYRAVTWAALEKGIPIDDEEAISHLAKEIVIETLPPVVDDGRQYTVLVDGRDVTWDLRRPEVDQAVSPVSAYPGVRAALTAQQRRIGKAGRVVMVGRDIGTVVLPDADLKIYLDATVDERAKRRFRERKEQGEDVDLEQVLLIMKRRDQIDSTRAAAPLKPAKEARLIDSTNLSIEEVLEQMLALVEAWGCPESGIAQQPPSDDGQ